MNNLCGCAQLDSREVSTVSDLEQVANLLCAKVNAGPYMQLS